VQYDVERYRPMVEEIFTEFNLPMDLIFLSLVESGFSTHAKSRAQAVGPWQFIKGTAKAYDLRVDKWIDERRDPLKSTIAAAILRGTLKKSDAKIAKMKENGVV